MAGAVRQELKHKVGGTWRISKDGLNGRGCPSGIETALAPQALRGILQAKWQGLSRQELKHHHEPRRVGNPARAKWQGLSVRN